MKKPLVFILLLLVQTVLFSQVKIAGKYSSKIEICTLNQQRGQLGEGKTINVSNSYLFFQGKEYKLYRFSKEEINSMYKPFNEQQSLVVSCKDFYVSGNLSDIGKYCLFSGTIDVKDGIIYSATLLEVYDEIKIIEALNKCANEK
jgi:hypothetical protein